MRRKIWKSTVVGIGPFVVEKGEKIDSLTNVICTTREEKDAQEIANIPLMMKAISETVNYLKESPAVLKLNKDDLLDVLAEALIYQVIE